MIDYDLYCGDCLEVMQDLINEGVQVDLILTDPPYGILKGLQLNNTNFREDKVQWDSQIPTNPMFKSCERLLRRNGVCLLFSQEPYTSHLRQFKYQNLHFIYPLYWFKDNFANFLGCKKAPVSYAEDLSVFRKKYDTTNKHPLRQYAKRLLKEMGVSYKDIERRLGHRRAEHFFYRTDTLQFGLCTEQTYNELINIYHIDQYDFFKTYEELKRIDDDFKLALKPTFNLQEGNKYKSNILQYPKPNNHYHPTEKPVPLLEDLIKTYTNENDLVLDFTMGSGSAGVACANNNRNFIGIELDKDYFKIAEERIKEANQQTRLM